MVASSGHVDKSRRLVSRTKGLVSSERERGAVSQSYTDPILTADESRVEPAPAEWVRADSVPSFSHVEFFETWLRHLFAWRSDAERNVLMRMIYVTLEEWGMFEGDFPNPAEEGFLEDAKSGFKERPSPFFAKGGGICALVLGGADSKRASPAKFLERIFGDSISADQVFYALFGDTPPDTRGLVFPRRNNSHH